MTSQPAHTISIGMTADDPRLGLTLREMASLVQEALRSDIDLDSPVLVRAGWHAQIQRIAIGGRP